MEAEGGDWQASDVRWERRRRGVETAGRLCRGHGYSSDCSGSNYSNRRDYSFGSSRSNIVAIIISSKHPRRLPPALLLPCVPEGGRDVTGRPSLYFWFRSPAGLSLARREEELP
ncbi:unnamed protein product [Lampetra planeri]